MKELSLKKAVAFYLENRRRLGFALRAVGYLLGNMVDYAQEVRHRGPLTNELALNWSQQPPAGSRRRARRLEAVRHFALFWRVFDPRTQVPPAGLFGAAYGRKPVHIYKPEERTALLRAAQQLPPSGSVGPVPFTTLLGLLACSGLRISEALGLQLRDWDPTQAVLTIRETKFGQSRCLPLSRSAAAALNDYFAFRKKAKSRSAAFFLNERGQPLSYEQVARTFAALRDQLRWQDLRPRPRLHDLRHTFAVGCLLSWYRQGAEELNSKIFSLAVYLGHRNIQHTYWYVSAVPELLALGSARRAKNLGRREVAHD